MRDEDIWKREEVASPCNKICLIHPTERLCTGCYRTLEEIATWSQLTPEARRDIMGALSERAPRLAKRRGGRSARLSGSSGK